MGSRGPHALRTRPERKRHPIVVTMDMMETWLASRMDNMSRRTLISDRWALMLLADTHPALPFDVETVQAFVQNQAQYLGGRSQQTLWDRLRVFYSWARSQGYAVPDLPYVGFGRRRVGERRGRKSRA